MCPNCGGFHDFANCPYLTMNAAIQPPRDFAQEEEETIRVKGLQDLVIPNPPTDAGQARGYTNQVFLAVGKLQKTCSWKASAALPNAGLRNLSQSARAGTPLAKRNSHTER